MRLSYGVTQDVSLEMAYQMESQTAEYFESLLIVDKQPGLLLPADVDPLSVHVAVADRIATASQTTVTAAVSLLYYESDGKIPSVALESILTAAVQMTNSDLPNFSPVPNDAKVSFEFQYIDNSTKVLNVGNDSRTSTEIGLIVATILLSVILLVVSSVLLHITGGWAVCKSKVSNCLFEEIDDDDEYEYPEDNNKLGYPVHTESYEDEEQDGDGVSNMTSVLPDSASGILGVNRNPTAGMGIIRTDVDDEGSSMMYGTSPVSQNSVPVGISSLRKLPKTESPGVRGGLSTMVMNRFARSAEKNK